MILKYRQKSISYKLFYFVHFWEMLLTFITNMRLNEYNERVVIYGGY